LIVETDDADLFSPYKSYDIQISRNIPIDETIKLYAKTTNNISSHVGVVIKKTTNSLHICSGNTQWIFSNNICSFKPGMDVWISVEKL